MTVFRAWWFASVAGVLLSACGSADGGCGADSREVAFARSLSQGRLATLMDDVKAWDATRPPSLSMVSLDADPIPAPFSDLSPAVLRSPHKGVAHVRLKECEDQAVELIVTIGPTEYIELWWGQTPRRKEILWQHKHDEDSR